MFYEVYSTKKIVNEYWLFVAKGIKNQFVFQMHRNENLAHFKYIKLTLFQCLQTLFQQKYYFIVA